MPHVLWQKQLCWQVRLWLGPVYWAILINTCLINVGVKQKFIFSALCVNDESLYSPSTPNTVPQQLIWSVPDGELYTRTLTNRLHELFSRSTTVLQAGGGVAYLSEDHLEFLDITKTACF